MATGPKPETPASDEVVAVPEGTRAPKELTASGLLPRSSTVVASLVHEVGGARTEYPADADARLMERVAALENKVSRVQDILAASKGKDARLMERVAALESKVSRFQCLYDDTKGLTDQVMDQVDAQDEKINDLIANDSDTVRWAELLIRVEALERKGEPSP